MRMAVAEARKNLKALSGGPFGACIVKNGRVLAVCRNRVLKNKDATCHAEVTAIRAASRKLRNFDLSGCTIYSTNEPCPMCFSAIHWARIGTLVYGTSIRDVKRRGFNELPIAAKRMKKMGGSKVKTYAGFLLKECKKLLGDWDKLENKPVY